MNYIIKPAATLFFTAVIVIAAVSYAYNITLEPIERQARRTRETAMMAVLPQASDFRLKQSREPSGSIVAVYEGFANGSFADGNFADGALVGFVVELSPVGYGGNIDLMVGISARDEKITGVRILRHNETPGLGALAAREGFYRRFDNKPLVPLTVVRSSPGEYEIAAITASTITTRAVTNAVNEAIEWYKSALEGGGR